MRKFLVSRHTDDGDPLVDRSRQRENEQTSRPPRSSVVGFDDADEDDALKIIPSQRIVYRNAARSSETADPAATVLSGEVTPVRNRKRGRLFECPEKSDAVMESPETLLDIWLRSKTTRAGKSQGKEISQRSCESRDRRGPVRAARALDATMPVREALKRLDNLHAEGARKSSEESETQSTSKGPRNSASQAQEPDVTEDDDNFFNSEFINIVEEIEKKSQSAAIQPEMGPQAACSSRLNVRSVHREGSSLMLTVAPEDSTVESWPRTVELRDQWVHTAVSSGDVVRVVFCTGDYTFGPPPTNVQSVVIDDNSNFLIVHPDVLVSGTTVASSYPCVRKAVLSARNGDGSLFGSPAALKGKLAHSLFETALTDRAAWAGSDSLAERLRGVIQEIISLNIPSLYATGLPQTEAEEFLRSLVRGIVLFFQSYVGGITQQASPARNRERLVIDSVLFTEENVWSPTFGLKGKIDATLRVHTGSGAAAITPLEFKTGRVLGALATYHTAQLLLYLLLLSDRYDATVKSGLLTYMSGNNVVAAKENSSQDGEHTSLIRGVRSELASLIAQRNELARHMTADSITRTDRELPHLLRGHAHACSRCYMLDTCMVQNRLSEGGSAAKGVDGPGADTYKLKTDHLTDAHAEYYTKFRKKLTLEEAHAQKSRTEIWNLEADAREDVGRCWADLVLDPKAVVGEGRHGHAYLHEFRRRTDAGGDFTQSGIETTDYVVVSAVLLGPQGAVLSRKTAISQGFVREVRPSSVIVACSENMPDSAGLREWTSHPLFGGVSWRVDKEEMASGLELAKANLEAIFLPGRNGQLEKLRELAVDLREPQFAKDSSQRCSSLEAAIGHLNSLQRQAVEKAMHAEDYSLLLGLPGTGKTDTIATLAKTAADRGQSVLLTGYTHASVDNVLGRLLKLGERRILRLGNASQVDERIHDFLEKPCKTLAEFAEQIEHPLIVATTCMGVRHAVFSKRTFDLVIVDEAGQVPPLICLGPLRFARRSFLLVGDHNQLPPLSKYSVGEETDLEESLFKRLCDAHPKAVTRLGCQYRMAEDIMALSNELVYYKGKMSCGSEEVARRKLCLSRTPVTEIPSGGIRTEVWRAGETVGWLRELLREEARVVFVDTDGVNGYEEKESTLFRERGRHASKVNRVEAGFALGICASLVLRGVAPSTIGIISPFRAQVSMIRKAAVSLCGGLASEVDIRTIDQFQGCDRDCIVISFVRSNENKTIGYLLKDWRRINVAITRAKAKLVLLGSASTLRGGSKFMSQAVNYIEGRGWSVNASPVPCFDLSDESGGGACADPEKQIVLPRPTLYTGGADATNW